MLIHERLTGLLGWDQTRTNAIGVHSAKHVPMPGGGSAPRDRNKDGTWRKKRSDAGKTRKKKASTGSRRRRVSTPALSGGGHLIRFYALTVIEVRRNVRVLPN
ncbi:MAG: hypothetical protein ABI744_04225 [Chloroflexota bacterium]